MLQQHRRQNTPGEIQYRAGRSNNFRVGMVLTTVVLVLAENLVGDPVVFFEGLLAFVCIGAITAAAIYCRELAANKPRR